MALHYILDGYNIVKQIPEFADLKLEDGRESFIRYLEVHAPQGSRNNLLTIVFDGRSGMSSNPRSSNVQVFFSCDESADDRIKKMVAGSDRIRSLIVVTDDREIQVYVRKLGAKVLNVRDFIGAQRPHQDKTFKIKRKDTGTKDRKHINDHVQQEINSEMMRVWLENDQKEKKNDRDL